jgi:hypothetical protein
MRTSRITVISASAAVLAAVAGPAIAQSANSARTFDTASGSLAFEMTPVSDVVAQFHRTFGANIIVKPGIDPERQVSFTVNDIDSPGAAIETVQDLANALGVDWQKSFVITRAVSDDAVSTPDVDTHAPVAFKTSDMAADEAINAVASVDGATVKFYSPVDATVHFSSSTLPASQAAREIADQTHTVWKSYYVLAPRNRGTVPLGATIVGYTGSGSPILQLPIRTYVLPEKDKVPTNDTPANRTNVDNQANAAAAGDVPQVDTPLYPMGYPDYGYGYGNMPYGYNPYNYYGSGYYNTPALNTPGMSVVPQVYGPPMVFGGAGN